MKRFTWAMYCDMIERMEINSLGEGSQAWWCEVEKYQETQHELKKKKKK